jgi:hypothetical protein
MHIANDQHRLGVLCIILGFALGIANIFVGSHSLSPAFTRLTGESTSTFSFCLASSCCKSDIEACVEVH